MRRRAENVARKGQLKSVIKGFVKLVKEKNTEEAKKALPGVYKTVDKMGKTKLIKKGTANRIKSRLTKKIQALEKTG